VRRTLLAFAGLAALALPAAARADVRITSVRATDAQKVAATVVTSAPTTRPPTLRENGKPVAGLVAENLADGKSVVLAIDRSQSMKGAAFRNAIAAARAFVRAKPPTDRLAIVSFGSKAVQLTRFSSATIDADTALRGLSIDTRQGTALNDALALAAQAAGAEESPARVVVLLTDGTDTTSEIGETAAAAQLRRAGVSVYPIALESEQFSPVTLRRIAEQTGGTYRGTASPAELRQMYAGIAAELSRTWRLEFLTSAHEGETRTLVARAGPLGSASRMFTARGAAAGGGATLLPASFYESTAGTFAVAGIAAGLVLLGVALFFAARRGSWLRGRVAPHVKTYETRRAKKEERDRMAAAAELFRATERSFGHTRLWRRLQSMLERADLPLRTVELVYICAGAGAFAGLVVAVLALPAPFILAALAAGSFLPVAFVIFKGKKRLAGFEEQLPDILLTVAASLKAGHSFKQSMQSVVDEGRPPASVEFKRVLTEMQLGRPMDEALAEAGERVGSKDFQFVITAVTIQRQVGGSLAGLMDMVADTVRSRQQFARKVKGLTAMGRASAYVLVALPFFLTGALTLMNAEYMSPLFTTGSGHMLIMISLGSMTIGSLMLKKIVSFKV
jgi:tight adherence protein B